MATNPVSSRATLVQQFPLFAGLSLSDCANIVFSAREKRFPGGQTIFAQGDPVRQVMLLVSGCVKLTQFGQNGSEVILRMAGPGEIVGAIGMCVEGGHGSTAQTKQSSFVLTWDIADFGSALERFPAFRRNLLGLLESRLLEMDERFREVSTEKVAPRLSSQLVRLFNKMGKGGDGRVEINLSRAELAQLTGTTLFTVSRLLCQWETRGIVCNRRECVTLRDLAALENLSQEESHAE